MRRIASLLSISDALARGAAVVLVALALLTLTGPLNCAMAQSDESNAQFWLQERALQQRERSQQQQSRTVIYQRPTHLIRRAKPVRGFTLSEPAAREQKPSQPSRTPAAAGPPPATAPGTASGTAPSAPTPTAVAAPAAPQAPNAAPQEAQKSAVPPSRVFTIAVIGDSLGQFLEQGLTEFYADRPDVVILKRARDSTGLVREDYFNWVQAAKELASGKDHIDMAIMMIGSNDHQPIRDSSGVYDSLTPKWKQIYAARTDEIAAAFRDKKIPFLWVGAPIMKSASLSDAMLDFNDIYKASVSKEGGVYLDVWDLFADDSGQYALYGPDVNGDTARLRSSDGVHFTRAGALKLAQFVDPAIKRVMDGTKPQIDSTIVGVAPQIAPADSLTRSSNEGATAAAPERRETGDLRSLVPPPAAPLQPVIPIRPAAGPVVALTTPVLAPDGQLVTRALVQSSTEGENVEQTLTEGEPIQPRPGRADDFRWPPD